MRYLYYCNSTYQLLNVINLHWHRRNAGFEEIPDYHGELLLLNSFDEAQEICRLVREDGIFDRIILIDKAFNTGIFHILMTMMDVLSPAFYMKDKYGIDRKDIAGCYDVIVSPKYSMVIDQIWKLNKKAKLHLYEDGIGSYYDDIPLEPRSNLVRKSNTAVKSNSFRDFEMLYVLEETMYSGSYPERVRAIPKYDKDYLEHIKDLFRDFSYHSAKEKNIFWLSQFLNNEEFNRMVDEVLQKLLPYRDDVLFCQHPRMHLENKYGYKESDKKQIWELKLLNMEDIGDKLFISIHSTACFTAKMLFDLEPYIILFYKLGSPEVSHISDEFEQVLAKFRQRYREPDKIMIPESMDELQDCISRYLMKVK